MEQTLNWRQEQVWENAGSGGLQCSHVVSVNDLWTWMKIQYIKRDN